MKSPGGRTDKESHRLHPVGRPASVFDRDADQLYDVATYESAVHGVGAHEEPRGNEHPHGWSAHDRLREPIEVDGEPLDDARQLDDDEVSRGRLAARAALLAQLGVELVEEPR